MTKQREYRILSRACIDAALAECLTRPQGALASDLGMSRAALSGALHGRRIGHGLARKFARRYGADAVEWVRAY